MLPDSDRISPVPPYLSINSPIIFSFRIQDYYPLWSHFPECSTKKKLIGPDLIESAYLTTPLLKKKRFRLVHVRSPLLAESLLIYIPPGTKMFQFPGFALNSLYIQL